MPKGIYKRKRNRKPHYKHPSHYVKKLKADITKVAEASDVFAPQKWTPVPPTYDDGYKAGIEAATQLLKAQHA